MKPYLLAGALAALVATTPAAQAAVFNVGSDNFFLTSGDPFSPSITAVFFNGFETTTEFDDTFQFTIPQNGVGSGSISTSFSSNLNMLVIDELWINDVLYNVPSTGSGQSVTVGNIPIFDGVLNSIRVVGRTFGSGSYSGTATFSVSPIPEPASWALMIGGFALVGSAMRRRAVKVSFS
ncbi:MULTISPECIES: FxDxF family PEP-CTERM protein [Sphingobium]|uniref:PEP-CTERM protein-sorting domain-containing protein n=1 Tax=Sphingobium lignivorans TaxID=2735886 RepID=A0ABR6ND90_9SPHN|nr:MULTISPECIES: FxDxF family PEP-CTERM protein [Sphingobium]MBB5984488.1 hypothetical protein [Sphingobium lignivorans]